MSPAPVSKRSRGHAAAGARVLVGGLATSATIGLAGMIAAGAQPNPSQVAATTAPPAKAKPVPLETNAKWSVAPTTKPAVVPVPVPASSPSPVTAAPPRRSARPAAVPAPAAGAPIAPPVSTAPATAPPVSTAPVTAPPSPPTTQSHAS